MSIKPTFFLLGYSGRTPAQIIHAVTQHNGVLLDIRFSPRSRVPHWSGFALRKALGVRYCHVPEWGNRNYKGGPIEIVDFGFGLKRALASAETNRVLFLMCACKTPEQCHRSTIAKMLAKAGYPSGEFEFADVKPKAKQIRMPL